MLKGKNIVIGITGGIAVYKVVDVVSRLKKLNANIFIIMTKNATEFVTPLTFRSLSLNVIVTDMFHEPTTFDVEHISLAQKADLFLIAPATANIIGKISNGIADDMLSTVVMATKAPVWIAPAMNTGMYINPIVQRNIKDLSELGYNFIEPDSGRLACGDLGIGKLATPERIVEEITNALLIKKDLVGKKVLVTAGPTRELIDPVRYITNFSSGKMGYEIAKEARDRGADVTLVSGPVNLEKPTGINVISIVTAKEMYEEVINYFDESDIIIKAAAVADYTPSDYSKEKIKKSDKDLFISLKRTKDIAKEIGSIKNNKIIVGFAAESENVIENAKKKIVKKNFDFIVCNDISKSDIGFGSDSNIISIIDKDGIVNTYEKMLKSEVAKIIIDKIKTYL